MPRNEPDICEIIYTPEIDEDPILSRIPPRLCYLGRHEFSGDWRIHFQSSEYYILSYIQDGKAQITVRGKTYFAEKGDILLYRPHEIHGGKSIGKASYKTLIFRIDFSDEAYHHEQLKRKMGYINKFSYMENRKLRNLLDGLLAEYTQPSAKRNNILVKSHLLEVFKVVNEYLDAKKKKEPIRALKKSDSFKAEICLKAKKYMESHYTEKILLEEIADELSLSASRFSHIFKEYTRQSPMDYLIQLRIDKAKELLEKTDASVTRIGSEVGFSQTSYFIRAFRKLAQTTPSNYRNKIAR
jgi:AraC-like DNA-binding protein/quercetin dioxygenase-like cupin family protein